LGSIGRARLRPSLVFRGSDGASPSRESACFRRSKDYQAALLSWKKEKRRVALEHGPALHLGALRKGYTTEALKEGVDTVTVAHLLGHRDPSMVAKVYGHVQVDPEYMMRAARRAKGG
jgi:integrase